MTVSSDARPGTSALRVQLLLAARGGCRGELADAASSVADDAAGSLGDDARVVLLTQFHVDPAASASVARRLGLGSTVVDSVSELHLDSLESFFAGIGDGRLGAEAAADEELFVDRENSVSFCTVTKVVAP